MELVRNSEMHNLKCMISTRISLYLSMNTSYSFLPSTVDFSWLMYIEPRACPKSWRICWYEASPTVKVELIAMKSARSPVMNCLERQRLCKDMLSTWYRRVWTQTAVLLSIAFLKFGEWYRIPSHPPSDDVRSQQPKRFSTLRWSLCETQRCTISSAWFQQGFHFTYQWTHPIHSCHLLLISHDLCTLNHVHVPSHGAFADMRPHQPKRFNQQGTPCNTQRGPL